MKWEKERILSFSSAADVKLSARAFAIVLMEWRLCCIHYLGKASNMSEA